MSGDIPRGRFVWYDLMTNDPAGAEAFYTRLIGWGTQLWEGGETKYTMWTRGEDPIGGVMPLPDEAKQQGAPPHWLAYVSTPDIDADFAAAGELGAKTYVPPTDIPTVGRFAVLADPQGATFALFTPEEKLPGHGGPANEREISWHELATTAPAAAWDFYHALFGWHQTETMDMGEAGTYQMFRAGDLQFPYGGMFTKPPQVPVPNWMFYIRVGDLDGAMQQVTALGGQVLNGPMEVPGGDRVAQCMDPDGAAFALHQTAS